MKRILITGADSYIGTSFDEWLKAYSDVYMVTTVDTMKEWKHEVFEGYDVVLHVAGIAHSDTSKISEGTRRRYYKVNCDLALEVAKKAKRENVSQFIFMSSISIYGESFSTKKTMITKATDPKPRNCYGRSKLLAEKKLTTLEDHAFKLVILRPPMIYGKGCKGNYPLLSKMAKRLPAFPDVENYRSMLHVDNLCEFIRLIIDNQERGVFFPQNKEYVKTSDMVRLIASVHGKKIFMMPRLNMFIRLLERVPGRIGRLTNKAFGNMQYDMELSNYKTDYRLRNFVDSIILTEGGVISEEQCS